MIKDCPMKNRLIVDLVNRGILRPEHLKPIPFHYFIHNHKLTIELEAKGILRGES